MEESGSRLPSQVLSMSLDLYHHANLSVEILLMEPSVDICM
jgi:hypothetical protein